MEDILFRFYELIERLEADPTITVLEAETYRGASEADFDYCEAEAKVKIPADIREFYQMTNGLLLVWKYNDGESFRFRPLDIVPGHEPKEFGPELTACINIGPINEVFTKDWEETIYFFEDREHFMEVNGQKMNSWDFKRRFFPMDLFSKTNCMGFFALTPDDAPRVILADDYYISFRDSKPTDFRSYLEFLLATEGRCDARDYFGYGRSCFDPLIVGDAAFWKQALQQAGFLE
jgi:hypothetical protein